eukprot:sb/3469996/
MLAPVKLISPVKMNNGLTKVTVPEGNATSQEKMERPAVQKRRAVNMPNSKHPFPCFWKNCTGWFERSVSLAEHLMTVHFRDSDNSCQWLTCDETPGTRSKSSLEFHLKNVHAKAPKMTSLPKRPLCTLDVQNAFSKVEPDTENGESSLTSSLHILVTLILRNFLYYTPALVETITEDNLAVSLFEGSRTLSDVLALWSGHIDSEDMYVSHLPPFR